MRTLAATLFAAALAVVLTPPFLLPTADGAWIIRKVSAGGASYIVNGEGFEETGQPTANTWSVTSGTINWDSTAHASLSGEAMRLDATGEDVEVALGSGGTFWAAGKFEWDSTGVVVTTSFTALRDASNTAGVILVGSSTGDRAACFLNGSTVDTASTFAFVDNTVYYFWLRYEPNGTSGVYISTSSTRPTAPADTSTSYAHEGTDTANLTITKWNFRSYASTSSTSYFVDDIYADDAEIGTPW